MKKALFLAIAAVLAVLFIALVQSAALQIL